MKRKTEYNELKSEYMLSRLLGRFAISKAKVKLLESCGWYRNMMGGYTHPHAMDFMTFREIQGLDLKQLEYKLKHGSQAVLPADLVSD